MRSGYFGPEGQDCPNREGSGPISIMSIETEEREVQWNSSGQGLHISKTRDDRAPELSTQFFEFIYVVDSMSHRISEVNKVSVTRSNRVVMKPK